MRENRRLSRESSSGRNGRRRSERRRRRRRGRGGLAASLSLAGKLRTGRVQQSGRRRERETRSSLGGRRTHDQTIGVGVELHVWTKLHLVAADHKTALHSAAGSHRVLRTPHTLRGQSPNGERGWSGATRREGGRSRNAFHRGKLQKTPVLHVLTKHETCVGLIGRPAKGRRGRSAGWGKHGIRSNAERRRGRDAGGDGSRRTQRRRVCDKRCSLIRGWFAHVERSGSKEVPRRKRRSGRLTGIRGRNADRRSRQKVLLLESTQLERVPSGTRGTETCWRGVEEGAFGEWRLVVQKTDGRRRRGQIAGTRAMAVSRRRKRRRGVERRRPPPAPGRHGRVLKGR